MMRSNKRVHIVGASGSGVTTFGRALATDWSVPHHDSDDYYWVPTEPPFTQKRPIDERLALMKQLFLPRSSWVLSGSLFSWADTLLPYFDAVIFVNLENQIRMERIREREERRYGAEAIAPTGNRHDAFMEFMAWNAQYEDPDFTGRSRVSHENWLTSLHCPVLKVDSQMPVDEMVAQINEALNKSRM